MRGHNIPGNFFATDNILQDDHQTQHSENDQHYAYDRYAQPQLQQQQQQHQTSFTECDREQLVMQKILSSISILHIQQTSKFLYLFGQINEQLQKLIPIDLLDKIIQQNRYLELIQSKVDDITVVQKSLSDFLFWKDFIAGTKHQKLMSDIRKLSSVDIYHFGSLKLESNVCQANFFESTDNNHQHHHHHHLSSSVVNPSVSSFCQNLLDQSVPIIERAKDNRKESAETIGLLKNIEELKRNELKQIHIEQEALKVRENLLNSEILLLQQQIRQKRQKYIRKTEIETQNILNNQNNTKTALENEFKHLKSLCCQFLSHIKKAWNETNTNAQLEAMCLQSREYVDELSNLHRNSPGLENVIELVHQYHYNQKIQSALQHDPKYSILTPEMFIAVDQWDEMVHLIGNFKRLLDLSKNLQESTNEESMSLWMETKTMNEQILEECYEQQKELLEEVVSKTKFNEAVQIETKRIFSIVSPPSAKQSGLDHREDKGGVEMRQIENPSQLTKTTSIKPLNFSKMETYTNAMGSFSTKDSKKKSLRHSLSSIGTLTTTTTSKKKSNQLTYNNYDPNQKSRKRKLTGTTTTSVVVPPTKNIEKETSVSEEISISSVSHDIIQYEQATGATITTTHDFSIPPEIPKRQKREEKLNSSQPNNNVVVPLSSLNNQKSTLNSNLGGLPRWNNLGVKGRTLTTPPPTKKVESTVSPHIKVTPPAQLTYAPIPLTSSKNFISNFSDSSRNALLRPNFIPKVQIFNQNYSASGSDGSNSNVSVGQSSSEEIESEESFLSDISTFIDTNQSRIVGLGLMGKLKALQKQYKEEKVKMFDPNNPSHFSEIKRFQKTYGVVSLKCDEHTNAKRAQPVEKRDLLFTPSKTTLMANYDHNYNLKPRVKANLEKNGILEREIYLDTNCKLEFVSKHQIPTQPRRYVKTIGFGSSLFDSFNPLLSVACNFADAIDMIGGGDQTVYRDPSQASKSMVRLISETDVLLERILPDNKLKRPPRELTEEDRVKMFNISAVFDREDINMCSGEYSIRNATNWMVTSLIEEIRTAVDFQEKIKMDHLKAKIDTPGAVYLGLSDFEIDCYAQKIYSMRKYMLENFIVPKLNSAKERDVQQGGNLFLNNIPELNCNPLDRSNDTTINGGSADNNNTHQNLHLDFDLGWVPWYFISRSLDGFNTNDWEHQMDINNRENDWSWKAKTSEAGKIDQNSILSNSRKQNMEKDKHNFQYLPQWGDNFYLNQFNVFFPGNHSTLRRFFGDKWDLTVTTSTTSNNNNVNNNDKNIKKKGNAVTTKITKKKKTQSGVNRTIDVKKSIKQQPVSLIKFENSIKEEPVTIKTEPSKIWNSGSNSNAVNIAQYSHSSQFFSPFAGGNSILSAISDKISKKDSQARESYVENEKVKKMSLMPSAFFNNDVQGGVHNGYRCQKVVEEPNVSKLPIKSFSGPAGVTITPLFEKPNSEIYNENSKNNGTSGNNDNSSTSDMDFMLSSDSQLSSSAINFALSSQAIQNKETFIDEVNVHPLSHIASSWVLRDAAKKAWIVGTNILDLWDVETMFFEYSKDISRHKANLENILDTIELVSEPQALILSHQSQLYGHMINVPTTMGAWEENYFKVEDMTKTKKRRKKNPPISTSTIHHPRASNLSKSNTTIPPPTKLKIEGKKTITTTINNGNQGKDLLPSENLQDAVTNSLRKELICRCLYNQKTPGIANGIDNYPEYFLQGSIWAELPDYKPPVPKKKNQEVLAKKIKQQLQERNQKHGRKSESSGLVDINNPKRRIAINTRPPINTLPTVSKSNSSFQTMMSKSKLKPNTKIKSTPVKKIDEDGHETTNKGRPSKFKFFSMLYHLENIFESGGILSIVKSGILEATARAAANQTNQTNTTISDLFNEECQSLFDENQNLKSNWAENLSDLVADILLAASYQEDPNKAQVLPLHASVALIAECMGLVGIKNGMVPSLNIDSFPKKEDYEKQNPLTFQQQHQYNNVEENQMKYNKFKQFQYDKNNVAYQSVYNIIGGHSLNLVLGLHNEEILAEFKKCCDHVYKEYCLKKGLSSDVGQKRLNKIRATVVDCLAAELMPTPIYGPTGSLCVWESKLPCAFWRYDLDQQGQRHKQIQEALETRRKRKTKKTKSTTEATNNLKSTKKTSSQNTVVQSGGTNLFLEVGGNSNSQQNNLLDTVVQKCNRCGAPTSGYGNIFPSGVPQYSMGMFFAPEFLAQKIGLLNTERLSNNPQEHKDIKTKLKNLSHSINLNQRNFHNGKNDNKVNEICLSGVTWRKSVILCKSLSPDGKVPSWYGLKGPGVKTSRLARLKDISKIPNFGPSDSPCSFSVLCFDRMQPNNTKAYIGKVWEGGDISNIFDVAKVENITVPNNIKQESQFIGEQSQHLSLKDNCGQLENYCPNTNVIIGTVQLYGEGNGKIKEEKMERGRKGKGVKKATTVNTTTAPESNRKQKSSTKKSVKRRDGEQLVKLSEEEVAFGQFKYIIPSHPTSQNIQSNKEYRKYLANTPNLFATNGRHFGYTETNSIFPSDNTGSPNFAWFKANRDFNALNSRHLGLFGSRFSPHYPSGFNMSEYHSTITMETNSNKSKVKGKFDKQLILDSPKLRKLSPLTFNPSWHSYFGLETIVNIINEMAMISHNIISNPTISDIREKEKIGIKLDMAWETTLVGQIIPILNNFHDSVLFALHDPEEHNNSIKLLCCAILNFLREQMVNLCVDLIGPCQQDGDNNWFAYWYEKNSLTGFGDTISFEHVDLAGVLRHFQECCDVIKLACPFIMEQQNQQQQQQHHQQQEQQEHDTTLQQIQEEYPISLHSDDFHTNDEFYHFNPIKIEPTLDKLTEPTSVYKCEHGEVKIVYLYQINLFYEKVLNLLKALHEKSTAKNVQKIFGLSPKVWTVVKEDIDCVNSPQFAKLDPWGERWSICTNIEVKESNMAQQ